MSQNLATVQTNPFRVDRILHEWQDGETVADILKDLDPCHSDIRVWIGNIEIRPEYFHVVHPNPNSVLVVKAVPAGSDGLRAIAFIALAVAAAYTGGAAFGASGVFGTSAAGAAAVSGATFAIGSLLINALIPIDTPELDNGANESQALSIGTARNRLTPFGNLPVLCGFYQCTPPYASRPYTELVGEDQYVVMLFTLGFKNIEVDPAGIKIGTSLASEYDQVQIELDTGGSADSPNGITMYAGQVFEDNAGKIIPGPSGWAQHTTAQDTSRVTYEIHFPGGLIKYEHNDGKRRKRTVNIRVQYSSSPTGPWQDVPRDFGAEVGYTHSIQARTSVLLRKGYEFRLPNEGQWHFRMQADVENQDGADGNISDGPVVINERYFQILRSYNSQPAINDPDNKISKVCVRIKATDQLNGIPNQVSMYCQSIIPDWDTAAWTDAISNNQSSLVRWALTNPNINARALTDTRLDDQSFIDFWNHCNQQVVDTKGQTVAKYTYNQNIDFNTTISNLVNQIARTANGRVEQIDGVWKVLIDVPQSVPRQIFSPRNAWGMNTTKSFPEQPHGFRIRFVDETDRRFTQEERIVYADGYNINNATLFESLEAVGITRPDSIQRYGRRYLAVAQLQPEEVVFNVDPEHLATIVGDLVLYEHDALKIGLGAARIKSVDDTTVVVDAYLPNDTTPAKYAFQFRSKDGTVYDEPVDTPAELESNTFTFSNAPIASTLTAGDLAIYGERQKVSLPLLIKNIEPKSDLAAKLVCLPYAAGVYNSDTESIPPYDPLITEAPGGETPLIQSIQSDEYVMYRDSGGTLQPRMVVNLGFLNERFEVQAIIVQFRIYSDDANNAVEWTSLAQLPEDTGKFTINGISEGDQVEVRLRYLKTDNSSGPWAYFYDYTADTPYHTVIGKSNPPPSLVNFTVVVQASGLREYRFDFGDKPLPPDMDGFKIYYFDTDDLTGDPIEYDLQDQSAEGGSYILQDGTDYVTQDIIADEPPLADMTELYQGRIQYSPFEYNGPFTGTWIFAVVSVDVGNLLSAPLYTPPYTLSPPQLGNSLFYYDSATNNWLTGYTPGAVDNGTWQVSDMNYLQALVSNTWGSTPPTWASNFTDGWLGTSGAGGFVYEMEPGAVPFDPALTSGSAINLRLQTSTEASAGSYSFEVSVNGLGVWTAFDDGDTYPTGQTTVTSLEFRITGLNVPAEGLRNWVIEAYASA